MCFKPKNQPAAQTVAVPLPTTTASNESGAGVLVKGDGSSTTKVTDMAGDDNDQKRRRRSASQGLGL